jgi:hypothetical protein
LHSRIQGHGSGCDSWVRGRELGRTLNPLDGDRRIRGGKEGRKGHQHKYSAGLVSGQVVMIPPGKLKKVLPSIGAVPKGQAAACAVRGWPPLPNNDIYGTVTYL